MLKVGLVGSENSHTLAYAKLMNVEKKVRNAKAVLLWGEEPAHTQRIAEEGKFTEIVSTPEDMIGRVDVAIVDHRHAKYHLPAALPLLKARIPLFIDKPFCWTLDEGKKFLDLARRKNVLVTSYSSLRYSDGFLKDKKAISALGELTSVDYYGPCDINSIYGGIYFYGIHQVEMMVAHLGVDVEAVQFCRGKAEHHTAAVCYKNGLVVTLHLLKDFAGGFQYTFCGKKSAQHFALDYTGAYENALKAFLRMVATGKNDLERRDILGPVAIMEALAKSVKSGAREKLAKF